MQTNRNSINDLFMFILLIRHHQKVHPCPRLPMPIRCTSEILTEQSMQKVVSSEISFIQRYEKQSISLKKIPRRPGWSAGYTQPINKLPTFNNRDYSRQSQNSDLSHPGGWGKVYGSQNTWQAREQSCTYRCCYPASSRNCSAV